MKTKSKKIFLYTDPNGFEAVFTFDASDVGYTLIGTCESAEFILREPAEVVAEQIAKLEELAQKERADSQVRLNAIAEKIQSLLAITHVPGEA